MRIVFDANVEGCDEWLVTGTWDGRAAIPQVAARSRNGIMTKTPGVAAPARRMSAGFWVATTLAASGACTLDKIPEDLRPTIEPRLPLAISVAKSAAAQCAEVKHSAAPPPAVSPAADTALATDLAVVDILVRCRWADEQGPAPPSAGHTFEFPPLHGAPRHAPATPPVLVYDSYIKPGDLDFERVHVPSVYSDIASSADIVATEPIPDGGAVEVTVAVRR